MSAEPKTARPKSTTTASVRARLSRSNGFGSGDILLDGQRIGGFVSYGKIAPGARRDAARKTVVASRIYHNGVSVQVEAGSADVLLGKVAKVLAAAMKEGRWTDQEKA